MSIETTIIGAAFSLVIVGLWLVHALNAQKSRDKKRIEDAGD